jgi:hypothetical protein
MQLIRDAIKSLSENLSFGILNPCFHRFPKSVSEVFGSNLKMQGLLHTPAAQIRGLCCCLKGGGVSNLQPDILKLFRKNLQNCKISTPYFS